MFATELDYMVHSHGEGLGIVQTAMQNQADVRRHHFRRINLKQAIQISAQKNSTGNMSSIWQSSKFLMIASNLSRNG